MRTKTLLTAATGLIVCAIAIMFSQSIQGNPKTYEVHPEITMPEYRADSARAIDAYERLMDRYMGLTERNLVRIETKLDTVVRKLDSIDKQLKGLSLRISRIEKTLVTGGSKSPARTKDESKSPDKKQRNYSHLHEVR